MNPNEKNTAVEGAVIDNTKKIDNAVKPRKIRVTDNIMDDVRLSGLTVNEALAKEYEGEIQDKIKKNEAFKDMTPLQMAMFDAGISKKSKIRDFVNQGAYTTSGAGEWLLPAYIDTTLHEFIDMNNILGYIVGSESSVDNTLIQTYHVDMTDAKNKENAEMVRVEEGGDLPIAKIALGKSGIQLYKYGRAVEQTYEAFSQMRVDMFAKTLEYIAQDIGGREIRSATMVALKGDGNDNAAKALTFDTTKGNASMEAMQTALNSAFIDYNRTAKMPVTTIIAGGDTYKKLAELNFKTDVTMGISGRYTLSTPQLNISNIQLIDYGADEIMVGESYNKKGIIVLNNSLSLTKHTLNGSMIQEYSQNIRNQTKLGTISEITGFSKNMPDGVMYIQIEK